MKKFILFVLLIVYLSSSAFSQLPYYDALNLEGYLMEGKFNPDMRIQIDSILSKYILDPDENISESFGSNPFINEYFLRTTPHNLVTGVSNGIGTTLGGIAIPNEILLGVTDWIIKRTKQELSVYFFENFKKQIKTYPDLQTIFPQTYSSLDVLGEEIYNYQRYLKTLRAAFQNDMRLLTQNFPSIIDNHPEFFVKHPELAASLHSGFYIADALQEKIHPGDILNNYPSEFLDDLKPNWKGAVQILQLISASVRDTTAASRPDSVFWVPSKQIKTLVKDKVAFKIYLGLLYQQAKTTYDSIHFISLSGKTSFVAIFDKVAPAYDSVYSSYSLFIMHFSEKTNKLNTLIKENENTGSDSNTFQSYYDYYTAVLDLLEHSTELSNLPFFKDQLPDLDDTLKDYFDVARTTADLFLNVRQHNYSTAVTNAVHIYDLTKAIQGEKDAVNPTLSVTFKKTAGTFNPAKGNVLRYGSFLAAISEANSPEEVQKVIESFALPPGSSRIKRQSLFNISLNAYCGLFLGNEIINGLDSDNPFGGINSYGLAVPIGISISQGYQYLPWPISEISIFHGSRTGWASTWFVSLVELGAVAAYRFGNENVEQVPTIQLRDIFSPGLFWSLGIPKSPLSFTLGAQVGPNLRKVNNVVNDYSDNTYVRYSASVCADIPVFNLYTKAK